MESNHPDDPYSPERDRGFLTKKDREYLGGSPDLAPSTERRRRRRIRGRLRNAVLDFRVIFECMNNDEIRTALAESPEDADRSTVDNIVHVGNSFNYILAFTFLADILYAGADQDPLSDDGRIFETMVEASIKSALSRVDTLAEVTVDLEVEKAGSIEKAAENIQEQPVPVLQDLLSMDLISPEEFAGEIQRRKNTDEI